MFKHLVNPALAKEVELDRPASGWPERIFRFSLFYSVGVWIALAVLRLFLDEKVIESDGGPIGAAPGILFGLCFFYMLNYLVWRYVKSRVVKVAWWSLMSVVALLVTLLLSGVLQK
jgi:hypothetical protein